MAHESVSNWMSIHPIDVRTFQSKSRMSTSWWCWKDSQGITKIMMLYPLGNMDVCIKLHLIAFKCKSVKVFFVLVLSRDVEPVVFAIRRGDVKAVNDLATSAPLSLLKENEDGWIPLHDAAFCGQTECLKILLRGMTLKAMQTVNVFSQITWA